MNTTQVPHLEGPLRPLVEFFDAFTVGGSRTITRAEWLKAAKALPPKAASKIADLTKQIRDDLPPTGLEIMTYARYVLLIRRVKDEMERMPGYWPKIDSLASYNAAAVAKGLPAVWIFDDTWIGQDGMTSYLFLPDNVTLTVQP